MLEQDEMVEGEPGSAARGILIGVGLGLLLWAVIIVCVMLLFF